MNRTIDGVKNSGIIKGNKLIGDRMECEVGIMINFQRAPEK
jgi:hypothetical protein